MLIYLGIGLILVGLLLVAMLALLSVMAKELERIDGDDDLV